MKKLIIVLSFILAISQIGTVSHAFDNLPASTRSHEISDSDENLIVDNGEDTSNPEKKTVVLLIPLKNSAENGSTEDEISEEEIEGLNHEGHITKRCKAELHPPRVSRRISIPIDSQKYFSVSTVRSVDNSEEDENDGKSYFRLASIKDAKNILRSLLKSKSSKGEDKTFVSKRQNPESANLGRINVKKTDNQRPKKYVCYSIEDNCKTTKSKTPSRSYTMNNPVGSNILTRNGYAANGENRRIPEVLGSEQQMLEATHNLHCPPGAVLVEESDYSRISDRKLQKQKRPVKKCPPNTMPCASEAQSIGQPTKIDIPLAGNRRLNGRLYKVDRKSSFVPKLQSILGQKQAGAELSYPQMGASLGERLNLQNNYNNQQEPFNPYARIPLPPNIAYPHPYLVYPEYPEYPQYANSFVGEPQVPLQPVDPLCETHQEPPYEAPPMGKSFLSMEECIKIYGPNFCIVSTTTSASVNDAENAENYVDEIEEPIIGSDWGEEIQHATTESPESKATLWGYSSNKYDTDRLAATYYHEPTSAKQDAEGNDEQYSDQYTQSGVATMAGQHRGTTAHYFSGQSTNRKIQPEEHLSRVTTPSYGVVGSNRKIPPNFDVRKNFIDSKSAIHHSDPDKVQYLIPVTHSDESGTEDYYDASAESAESTENGISPSLGNVPEYPRLEAARVSSNWQGAHGIHSTQYLEYTTKPTTEDLGSSPSDDTSEEIAQYVPSTHDPDSARYTSPEYRYSSDSFIQQQNRNGQENIKSYTASPTNREDFPRQHSTIHGSLSNVEVADVWSTLSPDTVYVNLEVPRGRIPAANLDGNGFEGSQRITTVYPVIDNEDHPVSTTSRNDEPINNRIGENSESSSPNLYYSIESEQPTTNFATHVSETMNSYTEPIGIAQSTLAKGNKKIGFVSSVESGSDNRYATSYGAIENSERGTMPPSKLNKPGQRTYTEKFDSKLNIGGNAATVSSGLQKIDEEEVEDRDEESSVPPYYTTRPDMADVRQSGDVFATIKGTNYASKPVGAATDRYSAYNTKTPSSDNAASAKKIPLDTEQPEEVPNHFSGKFIEDSVRTTEPGRKMTNFVNQPLTTDRNTQRQYVESQNLIRPESYLTSSTSDFTELPTKLSGSNYSPTTTKATQKNGQQLSKISSGHNFFLTQSDRPFVAADAGARTESENLGLAPSTTEDVSNNYTTAPSILKETLTADTGNDKSHEDSEKILVRPSDEPHLSISTSSDFDDTTKIKKLEDSLQSTKDNLKFEKNLNKKEESTKLTTPIINGQYRQSHPYKNYDQAGLTTVVYEPVSSQSNSEITGISDIEKSGYSHLESSTPMPVTHDSDNSTIHSNILKSKNLVKEVNHTKSGSSTQSTANNPQIIVEPDVRNFTEEDRQSSAKNEASLSSKNNQGSTMFAQEELTTERNIVSSTLPPLNVLKTNLSALHTTTEEVTKVVKEFSGIAAEVADNVSEKTISGAINDGAGEFISNANSATQKSVSTVLLTTAGPTATTIDENKTLPAGIKFDSDKGDQISDGDQKFLKSAIQKVVTDLISSDSKNAHENKPGTPESVGAPEQGLSPGLSIVKNLFSSPEVKNMAIDTVKGLISEASGVPEDSSLGQLKDHVIESVFDSVVKDLLPEDSVTPVSPVIVDEHRYENEHWTVVPVTLAPSSDNVGLPPVSKISNIIHDIVGRPGIGLRGARLPAVQSIIVRAVENALSKAKDVVDHSVIWDTLNKIITRAEEGEVSPYQSVFTTPRLPKNPGTKPFDGPMKTVPIIPVDERVFENGQWSDKHTILGKAKKQFQPKLATGATTSNRDEKKPSNGPMKTRPIVPVVERVFENGQWSDKHTILGKARKQFQPKMAAGATTNDRDEKNQLAATSGYKNSMINANAHGYTTNGADYAFLGESEEREDKYTTSNIESVTDDALIETSVGPVGVTASNSNIEETDDLERTPIKYFSPHDRILTYIKNHQTPVGMSRIPSPSPITDESSGFYRPLSEIDINQLSTIDGSDDVTTRSSEESSLGSAVNSKNCKCVDEDKEINTDKVGSSQEGLGHDQREQKTSTTESSELSSTIHHLDVTIDDDYSTDGGVSEEDSSIDATTKQNAEKVANTPVFGCENTVNYSLEDDEQNSATSAYEYEEEPNSSTSVESPMESLSPKNSGSNVASDVTVQVPNESNERNVHQGVTAPTIMETTVPEETPIGITKLDETNATTETHQQKSTKMFKNDESTSEATTLPHGLVGAAKTRGGNEYLQENMQTSSNRVTPESDRDDHQGITAPTIMETTVPEETPIGITKLDETSATAETHQQKSTKMFKNDESTHEATTLSHGLVGAAKTRGGNEYLQENIQTSSNRVTPESDRDVQQGVSAPTIMETTGPEETPIGITKLDETNATTETHQQKFTNMCKKDESTHEATTLSHGLVGAAKTRSGTEYLEENIQTSSNRVTPESDRDDHQGITAPAIMETTVPDANQIGITKLDETTATTETHQQKFTKMLNNYESTREATTWSHGLVGAAKTRGGNEYLQENIQRSSNCVTPKSDPTYFGKISLNGVNPGNDKISDLTNTDLFYVGDGVKIPLVIRRMSDGSYALSISDKICENFVKRNCPCCVPKEGEIVEERSKQNDADETEYDTISRRNYYSQSDSAQTESSEHMNKSKKRYARSTSGSDVIVTSSSPVKSFAKKYNLTLNLEEDQIPGEALIANESPAELVKNTGRAKRLGFPENSKILNLFNNNNEIHRDDSEERAPIVEDDSEPIAKHSNTIRRSEFNYDRDTNSFIRSLMNIKNVPENKRAKIVVNALDGLINSASTKNLSPMDHQTVDKPIDELSVQDQSASEDSSDYDFNEVENEMARYGYQKDNPILERIRFIKNQQHEHGQYKYQQNIDHQAAGKMNMLKTVLHWLREVYLEAEVKKNVKN